MLSDDTTTATPAPAFEALEPRLLLSSAKPTLAPLGNQLLLGGSPLLIPLNRLNPNAKKAKLTTITNDPNVTARVVSNGLTMQIQVKGFGTMTFALLNRYAPRAVNQIKKLAKRGFYDGVTFHRVINNFMIQTGDPTGTGSGGSKLPNFDDQFHVDLQHNRGGILSMAKSGDDTNNSQFFITAGPTRHLDFNHTIFGVLVKGDNVRNRINNVATNASDRPIKPVVITKVTVFKDKSSAVLMLKAPEGYAGGANVAVTASARVTQADGRAKIQKVTRVFSTTIQPDPVNGGPFLRDIPAQNAKAGVQKQIQLQGVDVEGDAMFYDAVVVTQNVSVNMSINNNTGLLTFTPPAGFKGTLEILVGVRAANGSDTQDPWDTQLIQINVTL
jgi:cyclophilin family peptidyl-prolyl cis-trans isomerase